MPLARRHSTLSRRDQHHCGFTLHYWCPREDSNLHLSGFKPVPSANWGTRANSLTLGAADWIRTSKIYVLGIECLPIASQPHFRCPREDSNLHLSGFEPVSSANWDTRTFKFWCGRPGSNQ